MVYYLFGGQGEKSKIMAKLLQPDKVIQMKYWYGNTWGYKWHLIEQSKKRLTACGIVIVSHYKCNVKKFSEIKAKDMCTICIKGLVIE